MPRRVARKAVTVPQAVGGAAAVEAPKPKAVRPGFEAGGKKAKVALDAAPAKPEGQVQRSVYEVKPGRPETVDAALAKLDALPGVEVETLGDIDGLKVQVATVKGAPPPPGVEPKRVLLTGGVHGSEPAGTISAVELLELVAKHPEQFQGFELTVVPLVNPEGFRDGTRHNQNDDKDLNREAEHDGEVPREMELVLPVLDRGPWALALDLHASGSTTAGGKNGFFAIRTAGNDELLHDVLFDFKQRHPVLDETTQRYTMVEPGVMESKNKGTVKGYLYEHGTSAAFTLEAPALLSLSTQVDGLMDFVQSYLKRVA